ncbi:hypothetical protein ASG17_07005 [Brevundimonas sp. Leaf363]|uniref:hypothetical protein n=1 Tax=Brevundimonas sp. Leaf363 TaxID=1736353 RepID=UPI0006F3F723|nr:hypothetical protein [Brevundimonas sp. Leaf363]KQS55802.1 hypothetical protein ASG17_07005 [Brevundimonas sp. Leaf363]
MAKAPAIQDFAPIAMGIQRGGALMVRLFHDGSVNAEDCVLRLVYMNGRFGNIPAGGNAKAAAALADPEALLRGHKRGSGLGPEHIDFVFTPRPGKLVQAAFVKIKTDAGAEVVPWAKGFRFDARIPRDGQEFRNNLTFKRSRHADEETVLASSFDVLNAFVGTPEAEQLAPYLVNAFVICTYKTVSTGAVVNPAMIYAQQIDALIDGMSPSHSMRIDREIARLSVHTALWHYAVHIGDRALFEASMDGIEAVSRMDREQHPTFAYNACKSLLLRALLMSFSDPAASRYAFALVYARFRAAAAIRTGNPVWLQELSVGLQASILAVGAIKTLKTEIELSRGVIRSMLELAPRVGTPAFERKLKALAVAYKTEGEARLKAGPAQVAADDDLDLDEDGGHES